LIVDDECSFRSALALAISDEGFEVETAINGVDALEVLARHSPDVIILDLHMPVMNGPQFVEEYARRFVQRAPIVVCSTRSREYCLKLRGVSACLGKPVDLDDLLATIHRITSPQPIMTTTDTAPRTSVNLGQRR